MATKLASAVMLLSGQLAGHGVLAATIASTQANTGRHTFYVLDAVRKAAFGAHGITTALGPVITCKIAGGQRLF
jgi:hypothetical protein